LRPLPHWETKKKPLGTEGDRKGEQETLELGNTREGTDS